MQREEVIQRLAVGHGVATIAESVGTSRQTVMQIRATVETPEGKDVATMP
jgi:hypothetical protein